MDSQQPPQQQQSAATQRKQKKRDAEQANKEAQANSSASSSSAAAPVVKESRKKRHASSGAAPTASTATATHAPATTTTNAHNANNANATTTTQANQQQKYAKNLPTQRTSPLLGIAPSPTATAGVGSVGSSSAAARFVFHSPPSLFRDHHQKPPVLGAFVLPGTVPPLTPPPPVPFPTNYSPVNLLRLLRTLTPSHPFMNENNSNIIPNDPTSNEIDYPLSSLWSFYDNPYGHEVSLLLDSSSLLQASGNPPPATEVYFVPYLSALVLYEKSTSDTNSSSMPLLQWFERVSPYQRLPLIDQIASIASCFSPSPSSPLYPLFSPFPSATILQDLRTSCLDLTRSWYAITWYPILHDPLTTPVLAGSFILYHAFELKRERVCPMKESEFRAAGAEGTTNNIQHPTPTPIPASSSSPPEPSQSTSPIPPTANSRRSDTPNSVGGTPEDDIESALDGESGDADAEAESDSSSSIKNPSSAPSSSSTSSSSSTGLSIFQHRKRKQLCTCGERHEVTSSSSSSHLLTQQDLPCFLPLLGYLCHRVLPSTWFVHAHTHATMIAQSNGTNIGIHSGLPPSEASKSVSSSKHHNAHLAAQVHHQLDTIVRFNHLLQHHVPIPSSSSSSSGVSGASAAFAHLTSAHQPTKLTHADLTYPMHITLQTTQHPDFLHMTNQVPTVHGSKER